MNRKQIQRKKSTADNSGVEAHKFDNTDNMYLIAAGIMHDLNNILTTISGYAELLQHDLTQSSGSREKAEKIVNAVKKAKLLVNKTYSLSGPDEIIKIPTNLYDILTETVDLFRSTIPAWISLKIESPDKTINVLAEPIHIFRIFFNLTINAIQSLKEKGGTLHIRTDITDQKTAEQITGKYMPEMKYAVVVFKDTGIGIDAESLGRIADPFFTTKEPGKGAGLGMSIVNGLLQEIKGELIVTSIAQKGSEFTIILPVLL
ncbi:MAG: hypothetical protein JXB24_02400 [Bacteroidales bacterium]|nr:hypothetical protein [Bacteroidales bacterium]